MIHSIKGFLQVKEDCHVILSFMFVVDVVDEVDDAVNRLVSLSEAKLVVGEDVLFSELVKLVVCYFLVDFAEYRKQRYRPVV